jgi:hypothetical protein
VRGRLAVWSWGPGVLQAKCASAQSVVLDGNPNDGAMTSFTHADVTQAALGYWSYRELSFLPQ